MALHIVFDSQCNLGFRIQAIIQAFDSLEKKTRADSHGNFSTSIID